MPKVQVIVVPVDGLESLARQMAVLVGQSPGNTADVYTVGQYLDCEPSLFASDADGTAVVFLGPSAPAKEVLSYPDPFNDYGVVCRRSGRRAAILATRCRDPITLWDLDDLGLETRMWWECWPAHRHISDLENWGHWACDDVLAWPEGVGLSEVSAHAASATWLRGVLHHQTQLELASVSWLGGDPGSAAASLLFSEPGPAGPKRLFRRRPNAMLAYEPMGGNYGEYSRASRLRRFLGRSLWEYSGDGLIQSTENPQYVIVESRMAYGYGVARFLAQELAELTSDRQPLGGSSSPGTTPVEPTRPRTNQTANAGQAHNPRATNSPPRDGDKSMSMFGGWPIFTNDLPPSELTMTVGGMSRTLLSKWTGGNYVLFAQSDWETRLGAILDEARSASTAFRKENRIKDAKWVLRDAQRQLREMKREVAVGEKRARAAFASAKPDIPQESTAGLDALNRSFWADMNRRHREDFAWQLRSTLEPYQHFKQRLDSLMADLASQISEMSRPG